MANIEEEKGCVNGREDYTQDGTVDLKGRPVLRSQTGRWRACSFMLGYEVFERMAYYGIASNLVLYLTRKLHEGTVKSSNNVTNWIGTVWITPLLGAYIADTYLGRYWTFMIASAIYLMKNPIASNLVLYLTRKLHEGTVKSLNNVTNWIGTVWITPLLGAYIADTYLGRYWTFMIASAIYLVGMCLLTLAVSLPALRPPSCPQGVKVEDCDERASSLQIGVFYCALYIIAVGTGGTKPNISTMGADQFDDFEPKERAHKLSFFNWWMFSIFFGTLFSNSFLIYIQDNVGWAVGYALPTLGLGISILMFVVGTPRYRHKPIAGSPLTKMAKVLVAAVKKWKVVLPPDPKELHELSLDEYSKSGKFRIDHTPSLRFLDKAAVKNCSSSAWTLCPVTQVEETKQMIKMIPILVAAFFPSTLFAQSTTLFIKQGTTLNRNMGPNFEIPPACLTVFVTIFMLISIVVYDRFLVPIFRKYTNNPRGITLLQRMGIGLVLHVIIMIIACLIERKRLTVARENGIFGKNQTVPLSIFVLLPQFGLLGVADNFLEVAKLEFFYDQAPEGMKSLGTAYFTTSLGVGFFLSSFILSTVADITKKNGHRGWILDNLNLSHLDYYYALYAVLSFLNLLFFLVVAKFFVYNTDINESKRELQEAMGGLPNKAATEDKNVYLRNVLSS